METIVQKVAMVGQVIADVTYAPLDPGMFQAELVGMRQTPQYKSGGFFVFTDLPPQTYTLRILGTRFQPREYTVGIPATPLIFEQPGDNDLMVVVNTISNGGPNVSDKITFDPVILPRVIRAGAAVYAAADFVTVLTAGLDQGRVVEAKLAATTGLTVGSIVRIVRNPSIRLRFDPYSPFPDAFTRIIGTITPDGYPRSGLSGVEVRLIEVNGSSVTVHTIAGAPIASVERNGKTIILGAEDDIVTRTNQQGDYNLYFGQKELLSTITLAAIHTGYQTKTQTITITEHARHRADFVLVKP